MGTLLRITEKVGEVTDELELRKRGYVAGSSLGEGSYAKVRSAYSERLNRKVALKIINRSKAPKTFQEKFLPRELDTMRRIQHPNIVQLFEIMHFNAKVYIVMEMAGHGDLLQHIRLRGSLAEDTSKVMFQQLVDAVGYLHNIDIVHRDLKCENMLLDTSNNLKLSDFGFARTLAKGDLSRTFCGSAAYAAPEILRGIAYVGPAYDIWSMGVILFIMVCGSMPYDDSNIKKMIKYQTERLVPFPKAVKLGQDVRDLVQRILEPILSSRYTMIQIQQSAWLKTLRHYYRQLDAESHTTATMAEANKLDKNYAKREQENHSKVGAVTGQEKQHADVTHSHAESSPRKHANEISDEKENCSEKKPTDMKTCYQSHAQAGSQMNADHVDHDKPFSTEQAQTDATTPEADNGLEKQTEPEARVRNTETAQTSTGSGSGKRASTRHCKLMQTIRKGFDAIKPQ